MTRMIENLASESYYAFNTTQSITTRAYHSRVRAGMLLQSSKIHAAVGGVVESSDSPPIRRSTSQTQLRRLLFGNIGSTSIEVPVTG